jgi:5-methylcytosine-specific restriction protein A
VPKRVVVKTSERAFGAPCREILLSAYRRMSLENDLHQEMIALYERAGEATGYWAHRYLQAVRRQGGLQRARAMLKASSAAKRSGLDSLLAAGRPDLSVEALLLEPRFAALFTENELQKARERLGVLERSAAKVTADRESIYPDELTPGVVYPEGARRQIRVNAYERNAKAREACLTHHGVNCRICGLDFASRYGAIGRGFIHVHHLIPVSAVADGYNVDPITDLIPVCPKCHAMLHRQEPPLEPGELKKLMEREAN